MLVFTLRSLNDYPFKGIYKGNITIFFLRYINILVKFFIQRSNQTERQTGIVVYYIILVAYVFEL